MTRCCSRACAQPRLCPKAPPAPNPAADTAGAPEKPEHARAAALCSSDEPWLVWRRGAEHCLLGAALGRSCKPPQPGGPKERPQRRQSPRFSHGAEKSRSCARKAGPLPATPGSSQSLIKTPTHGQAGTPTRMVHRRAHSEAVAGEDAVTPRDPRADTSRVHGHRYPVRFSLTSVPASCCGGHAAKGRPSSPRPGSRPSCRLGLGCTSGPLNLFPRPGPLPAALQASLPNMALKG